METVKIVLVGAKTYLDMKLGSYEAGRVYDMPEPVAVQLLRARGEDGSPYFARARDMGAVKEPVTGDDSVPEGVVTLPPEMKKGPPSKRVVMRRKALAKDSEGETDTAVSAPQQGGDNDEGGSVTI